MAREIQSSGFDTHCEVKFAPPGTAQPLEVSRGLRCCRRRRRCRESLAENGKRKNHRKFTPPAAYKMVVAGAVGQENPKPSCRGSSPIAFITEMNSARMKSWIAAMSSSEAK